MLLAESVTDATLIDEIERNLWETWSNFGRGPGCALHEEADALWFETPLPIIPYNGVLRFQGDEDTPERVRAIAAHFRERGVPFFWLAHPSRRPADLASHLTRHGLLDVEPIYGMACQLAQLAERSAPLAGIDIRKVESEADAGAFHQFAAWRWNIPDQYQSVYADVVSPFRFGQPGAQAHMWQAWRDGQPIAKAGLYLGSRTAGIYAVVTKPEARRLGLARALTLAALHTAREAGYGWAVLHSSPMAQAVYQGIGFRTLAEFRLFASQDVHV